MEIRLDPVIKNREILIELLASRGISINNDSQIYIVPQGRNIPEDGVSIVFNPDNIDEFINVIDSIKDLRNNKSRQHIIGKRKDGFSILPVIKILYFESMGNTVYCRTLSDRYEVNKKLYEIENEFASAHVIRINKSYIINVRWIDEIYPWFGGRLLLKFRETGEKLEVSRNYVKSFKKQLDM